MYYPGYSKTISTVLFNRAVTINYVPVFTDKDGVEYLDDGTRVPDSEGDKKYKLTTLDVYFDFGEGYGFVLPVKVGSDLPNDEIGLDQICEVILFTGFMGEYTAGRLKEIIKEGASSSSKKGFEDDTVTVFVDDSEEAALSPSEGTKDIAAVQDSDADKTENVDKDKEWVFSRRELFDEVELFSPFDPFVLAVLRYLVNHPRERTILLQAVERIHVDVENTDDAKTYPVYVHNGKNYLNLSAFQLPKAVTGLDYSNRCKVKKAHYSGVKKCEEQDKTCKFTGTHEMEYEGYGYIAPSVFKTEQVIQDSPSGYHSFYSFEMDELDLTPDGFEFINSCMAKVLAIDAAQKELRLLKAREGSERSAKIRAQKVFVGFPTSYKDYMVCSDELDEVAVTVDSVLAGWDPAIQKKVRSEFERMREPAVITIPPAMHVRPEFSEQEMMHSCGLSSSKAEE